MNAIAAHLAHGRHQARQVLALRHGADGLCRPSERFGADEPAQPVLPADVALRLDRPRHV